MAKKLSEGRKAGSGRKPGKAKTLAEGRKVGSGRKKGSVSKTLADGRKAGSGRKKLVPTANTAVAGMINDAPPNNLNINRDNNTLSVDAALLMPNVNNNNNSTPNSYDNQLNYYQLQQQSNQSYVQYQQIYNNDDSKDKPQSLSHANSPSPSHSQSPSDLSQHLKKQTQQQKPHPHEQPKSPRPGSLIGNFEPLDDQRLFEQYNSPTDATFNHYRKLQDPNLVKNNWQQAVSARNNNFSNSRTTLLNDHDGSVSNQINAHGDISHDVNNDLESVTQRAADHDKTKLGDIKLLINDLNR